MTCSCQYRSAEVLIRLVSFVRNAQHWSRHLVQKAKKNCLAQTALRKSTSRSHPSKVTSGDYGFDYKNQRHAR